MVQSDLIECLYIVCYLLGAGDLQVLIFSSIYEKMDTKAYPIDVESCAILESHCMASSQSSPVDLRTFQDLRGLLCNKYVQIAKILKIKVERSKKYCDKS